MPNVRYEVEIVWLEDIAALPYVREAVTLSPSRTWKPPRLISDFRLVGYAALSKEAIGFNRRFERRIFYLASRDAEFRLKPSEGVDPREVRAGERTPRLFWNSRRSEGGE